MYLIQEFKYLFNTEMDSMKKRTHRSGATASEHWHSQDQAKRSVI